MTLRDRWYNLRGSSSNGSALGRAILPLAVAVAGLVGCDRMAEQLAEPAGAAGGEPHPASSEPHRATAPRTDLAFGVTVHRLHPCPEGARARRLLVAAELTIEARRGSVAANPYYAGVVDEAGRLYRPRLAGCEEALRAGVLQPGQALRGWIFFDVPVGRPLAHLLYAPRLQGDGTRPLEQEARVALPAMAW